ncbi:MAG: heavy metal-associated domain-containing protein [Betaproteobacteria bacterium]
METINLTVSGMTCGACVKYVEKAINSIAGVQKVEVDLASGAVKVKGNVSQHVKEMIVALEEIGYLAQVSTDVSSKAKSGSCKSGSSCCYN